MKLKYTCVALVGALITANPAFAAKRIYYPVVEKGEIAAEALYNYGSEEEFGQYYAIEYGVNDFWMTEFGIEFEKESGENTKATELKWENVIAPFNQGEYWADVGFYFELEKALESGKPNHFETKLLLQKNIEKFLGTANLVLEKSFGPHSDDGVEGGLALQAKYMMDKQFSPAIEYYAEFGELGDIHGFDEQEHLIGPMAQGKIGHVKYDAGVLFGLSDSSEDYLFKVNLEYEF